MINDTVKDQDALKSNLSAVTIPNQYREFSESSFNQHAVPERLANQETETEKGRNIPEQGINRAPTGTAPLKENDILSSPLSPSSIIHSPVSASREYSLILRGSPAECPVIPQAPTGPIIHDQAQGNAEKPEAKKNAPKPSYTRIDKLNWFSPDELTAHKHLMSPTERRLLDVLETKRTKYPDGFDKGNYFQNIYPIFISNFSRREKIIYCNNFINGKKAPCHQWYLCSKCAFTRGLQSSFMYCPAFHKTHFFHLTCSFDGSLPLNATNSSVMQDYWKANEKAVRGLIQDGWFDGACIVHELALHSFLPVRVLPHSHIVLTGDSIKRGFKPALMELLQKSPRVELPCSLDVRLIENRFDLDRVLKYQTEAIELQEPYDLAWHKQVTDDIRTGAITLNQEMKEFLDAYGASLNQFPRIIRMGNLRPGTKEYLGVLQKDIPKPKGKKQRS